MENKRSHYELLNIVPAASAEEIEKAYGEARAIFSEDSAASYSLYTEEEKREKLSEISIAYETLKDPGKRKEYDRSIGAAANGSQPSREWDIKQVQAARDMSDRPILIESLKYKTVLKQPLIVMDNRDPSATEQYRILYTRLEQISNEKRYNTFAITSSVKGEGKTMTTLNLAYIMATEFRKKILLIEADLKNPVISSHYLELGKAYGLVDVINGDVDVEAAIDKLEDTSLYFLPARCSVKNSSVLLDSPVMRSVIEKVRKEYDYVLLDCPPILPLVDMNMLAKSVDGLMLVVRAGKTSKDLVTKAARSIAKANMLGIILNGSEPFQQTYY